MARGGSSRRKGSGRGRRPARPLRSSKRPPEESGEAAAARPIVLPALAYDESAPHRAGFVALLGPPNAGKSTLLNRLLGEKLAIVTARPQTTRSRILGILTLPRAQLMLVDTPGLHTGGKKLNVALNDAVEGAARDCDLALLLVDRTRGWEEVHDALMSTLVAAGKPVVVAGTKQDLVAGDAGSTWPPDAARPARGVLSLSARTGEGVGELVRTLIEALPESPPLYPEEELTDRPLRWLCAELIRESAFEFLEQEIPYALAVDVIRFDEGRADLPHIYANLLVERDSQKRIVIGAGGAMIKRIGVRARKAIEQLVGTQVHLELFVKVDPSWLENRERIEDLGYR